MEKNEKKTHGMLAALMLAALMLITIPGVFSGPEEIRAAETAYDYDSGTERVLRGWVEQNGNLYYYNKSGTMLVGKKTIGGKVYYFSKKKASRGALQTGIVKINGIEYYFKKSGKPGVIGRGCNGWTSIKGRGYCYCVNGKIIKNQPVIEDYYLNANGAMTTTSKKLYKLVKNTVKQLTGNGMTQEQKLRTCYNYLCSKTFTYVTKRPFSYASNWRLVYGYEMFTTHSGVCYNFSAALAYMARYIGYKDVKAIAGELLYLDGHWDLHSWTKILMDGVYYVFDSSMEHGGMGDFWKKTYEGTGRKYREWNRL